MQVEKNLLLNEIDAVGKSPYGMKRKGLFGHITLVMVHVHILASQQCHPYWVLLCPGLP